MKNYFALFLCLIALHFTACEKASETENQPITTEKVTSTDGKSIFGGTGLPNATIGNNGDFYLDKTTANLYGPKTDNAWPQPFNLANNTGTTGTPGTKILSGTIAPVLSIGAVGDFYFDTAALNFYGPKTAESWGLPISLKVQTDGAKVLILKNQVFNSVVRDTANDRYLLSAIAQNTKDKQLLEKIVSEEKIIYDYRVNSIPSSYSLKQKQALLDQYKIEYDNRVGSYPKDIIRLTNQIYNLEKQLVVGDFILNSEIAIDAKYQNYYDNGLIVVYLRNPLVEPSIWQESVRLIETIDTLTDYSTSVYCGLEKITKDRIYLKGRSYRVEEALIKAVKYDVKIVFIPASEVITMSAAKIDTHNLKAVTRYLGVALNK